MRSCKWFPLKSTATSVGGGRLPAILLAVVAIFVAAGVVAPPTLAQAVAFDLQAAVAAAEPGATVMVPAGVYTGPLVIDKPLVVEGQDWPVIAGDGSGDVVVITAPDVTLRGFVVRGTGTSLDREDTAVKVSAPRVVVENNRIEDALFGIYYQNAPGAVIRGNSVQGKDLPISRRGDGLKVWYSANALIEGNHVYDSRDVVVWFSPDTVLRNNLMEHNRYGLHFMSTDQQTVEHNVLRHNAVGVYLMYGTGYIVRENLMYDNRGPSGYGLGLKEVNDVQVEGNRFVNNRVGVYTDGSPIQPDAPVHFRRNLFAYNESGMLMLPNVKDNTFQENIFLDNGEQIGMAGGGDLTKNAWAVEGRGNYWSDYTGFDADGDRIGDLPYEAKSLFENLLVAYPDLRLFQLSPAADALDLAARAFPIFQPQPKMADPHPLTEPPLLPEVPGLPETPVAANLAISLAMVALATLVLGVGLGWRTR